MAEVPVQYKSPNCVLRPVLDHSDRHEFASCLQISAHLDHAIRVQESAILRLEILAQAPAEVRVEADLPSNLVWVRPPAGLREQAGVASRAPQHNGELHRASGVRPMAAGERIRLEGTVRAVAAGPAEVQVRAVANRPGAVDAAQDLVLLTVGDGKRPAKLTIDEVDRGVTAVPAGTKASLAAPHLRHRPVGAMGLPAPHGDDAKSIDGIGGFACVQGNWSYVDQTGATRVSRNYQVQVWDYDPITANDLLAVGLTDDNGNFYLCFSNDDGIEGAGQDVYLEFVSEVFLWRVQKPDGTPYVIQSMRFDNVADGSITDFGSLQPTALHRAVHAFDEANDAWLWKPGICWDMLEDWLPGPPCRQVRINWTPSSTDGTYYSLGTNEVHLTAVDPDSQTVVVHEIAHAVMDDVYEDAYPATPNCNPHYIQNTSSAGCAWTEGFAEWMPASVYNDPAFRFADGSFVDLETPTWRTGGWENGDTVEGRVAGALIDLSDAANEAYWERWTEGAPGPTWDVFLHNVSNTFAEYWQQRPLRLHGTDNHGPNASVYQNTIDYTFRDPIDDGQKLVRPVPLPIAHNYQLFTNPNRWQVVSLRGPLLGDYDLQLYEDEALTTLLASSTEPDTGIDFIAIDSTLRPAELDYPRVSYVNGDGEYILEYIEEPPGGGGGFFAMGLDDIAVVTSSYTDGPASLTITATPENATQDVELFLMVGTAQAPVLGRADAEAESIDGGPGEVEELTFVTSEPTSFAVVLINKAGAGTYTLDVTYGP